MPLSWTRLPFAARNREEFSRGLNAWLGQVFYETLPAHGYEVREEQIYTSFRLARALVDGKTFFAEAGNGTGKTFAYLLPAVAYARFRGRPVVVASSPGVLQAQLQSPQGDIQTLSRLLNLQIDARRAADPSEHICKLKVDRLSAERPSKGWRALHNWTRQTRTGARTEVPDVPDELWSHVAWDPTLPCDTCQHRGICPMMVARRDYRGAGDLVITEHRLFTWDLFTRAERHAAGQMPLLPPYSAVVLDEGHHVPELWARVQGYELNAQRLESTLERIAAFARRPSALGEARWQERAHLANVLVGRARLASQHFLATVLAVAGPGEGKRPIPRDDQAVLAAAARFIPAVEAIQEELATEEALGEGTPDEMAIRSYQDRLDQMIAALTLFQSPAAVPWVEGEDLWVVPRQPEPLYGPGRLSAGTPVLFSSATLAPAYSAGVLQLQHYERSQVGVPFNLAQQVLVYQPPQADPQPAQADSQPAQADSQPAAANDELDQVRAVIQAMQGRTLVLVGSLAEAKRYQQALSDLPWRVLCEGDADRGATLAAFRADIAAVLIGATFWEGVDVPGEALSCVLIPRLPFPVHDPLIRERRAQATARGEDPFLAVDLPELLIKLKQGAGRLIRSAQDRGVLALLDPTYHSEPWAEAVAVALPASAEQTADLARVAAFCRPVT